MGLRTLGWLLFAMGLIFVVVNGRYYGAYNIAYPDNLPTGSIILYIGAIVCLGGGLIAHFRA